MFVRVQVPPRVPFAGIAQLVEHDLAKVGVASSSLVSRSKFESLSEFRRVFLLEKNINNRCLLTQKTTVALRPFQVF